MPADWWQKPSKVYSNQILFSICSQSAIRLCTTLLGFCHQSAGKLCHISDSNLLTISDNTNSVHNLLPSCNQKFSRLCSKSVPAGFAIRVLAQREVRMPRRPSPTSPCFYSSITKYIMSLVARMLYSGYPGEQLNAGKSL